MEINFEKPVTETVKVVVEERDIETLKVLAQACLVDRTRVVGLEMTSYPYEDKIREICRKYGIDTSSKLGAALFLKGVFGLGSEHFS